MCSRDCGSLMCHEISDTFHTLDKTPPQILHHNIVADLRVSTWVRGQSLIFSGLTHVYKNCIYTHYTFWCKDGITVATITN